MKSEEKKDIIANSKRTEWESTILDSNDKSVVVRSPSFSYVVKKIEKLASGLHIVTGFIPTNESLRERLRKVSLCLLSDFLRLATGDTDQNTRHITIENSILELIMLFNVAYTSGYISAMNKEVITREYTELLKFIREHHDTFNSEYRGISDEFLNVPLPKESTNGNIVPNALISKGQGVTEEGKPIVIKDNSRLAPTKRQIGIRTDPNGSIIKRKDNRRSVVLGLLKNQNKINIKDVSSLISDCSEKTLQRELLAMVDEGLLIKEGERRWSTYSLVV